jgi:hypothetical protein
MPALSLSELLLEFLLAGHLVSSLGIGESQVSSASWLPLSISRDHTRSGYLAHPAHNSPELE